MIDIKKIRSALIEDCTESFSKEKRGAARRLLSSNFSSALDLCQQYSTIEKDLCGGLLTGYSDTEMGSILQVLRFFRKLDVPSNGNSAIDAFSVRQKSLHPDVLDDETHHLATEYVRLLLGPVPEFLPDFRHGPGSVYEGTLGLDKNGIPRSSDLDELWEVLGVDPLGRVRVEPSVQRTRITSVAKDWRGRRVIGMEPTWHMFTQLGLKTWLEHTSQRFIPYYNQDRQRQMLTRLFEYPLCTVDLSNASDHITVALVRDLFPEQWFKLLAQARTESYLLPNGDVERTESFALMGNGFCFPVLSVVVTSLAFATLSRVLGMRPSYSSMLKLRDRYGVQAYGDDLVFPVYFFGELLYTLSAAGLVVNYDKTGFGFFRETCGWYQFGDSSPFRCYYLKSLAWTNAQACTQMLTLQNMLYRHCYRRTAHAILKSAPEQVPLLGERYEAGLGKGLFHDGSPQFARYNKSRCQLQVPALAVTQQKRQVSLADQSGWVAAFHGGIPCDEPVGSPVLNVRWCNH